MHDITVSSMPPERGSCALPRIRLAGWAASNVHDYDEILARLLITSWTLATGRTLRGDVPPQMLSAEELISFWADEQMTADHARPPRPHTRGCQPIPAARTMAGLRLLSVSRMRKIMGNAAYSRNQHKYYRPHFAILRWLLRVLT